jgi:ABC-2 type transport system ATP-binding protein
VKEGSASDIKSAQLGQLFEVRVAQLQPSYDLLRTQLDPWRVSIFGDRLHVVLDRPDVELPELEVLLHQENLPFGEIQSVPFSLEDAFIAEVQRAGGSTP